MLSLDDPRWTTFEGGYRLPFDAAPVLRALEGPAGPNERALWDRLWDELHHQGDVGEATYHAAPHLLRIAYARPCLPADAFALVAVIEVERHRPRNPPLPPLVAEAYRRALAGLLPALAAHKHQDWDVELTQAISAAVAAAQGHHELARALLELDPDTTRQFLAEQIGYDPESEG